MSQDRNPSEFATHTEGEGDTLDLPEGMRAFTPGQVLGDRYEIRGLLGRGGMGEVWHAFDLKLRVEVALKAMREELFRSERQLELLRLALPALIVAFVIMALSDARPALLLAMVILGLGMGLAISRSIVEAHRGRIDILQSRLGGACVRVTLPIGEEVGIESR